MNLEPTESHFQMKAPHTHTMIYYHGYAQFPALFNLFTLAFKSRGELATPKRLRMGKRRNHRVSRNPPPGFRWSRKEPEPTCKGSQRDPPRKWGQVCIWPIKYSERKERRKTQWGLLTNSGCTLTSFTYNNNFYVNSKQKKTWKKKQSNKNRTRLKVVVFGLIILNRFT